MASLKRVEHKNGRVVYRIVISLGYDKDGSKLVKNLTYPVNQSSTPKQQEKEANKYAIDMEDKIKHGYDLSSEKMSFEDFACDWFENIKDTITYATYCGYEQLLRSEIIPYFRAYKLSHIKTLHIEAFYKTLASKYATGTINRYSSVLTCIFKAAIRWDMIDYNPCREARKPKKKHEEKGEKFFTPQQALMFQKSLKISYDVPYERNRRLEDKENPFSVNRKIAVPMQYKVFFSLSLWCGLRKGETLALHWSDIDFDKKEISITKSMSTTENGYAYKEPKTPASIRNIPLTDETGRLLKEYRKEYVSLKLRLGTAWQGNENLFIQPHGKPMRLSTPYEYFIKHLRRYNRWVKENTEQAKVEGLEELPIIPLHGLRHSCATLLKYLEVDIIDISKFLGHANCSTTMNIYTHSFDQQQRMASNKLNDFLRSNV